MRPDSKTATPAWVGAWWFWWILCLAGALPLLYPSVPPLTDVPGHIGRYAVQIDLATSPELQRWYGFHWALIPNLGVDLLVQLIGPYLGVELATKLIVMVIPVLQMAGYVLVARQAHGRVPATTLFALPLAWGYPFQFGFINFCLSTACATLAFALWMRMTGARWPVRTIVFAPIACLLWVMHIYGWAILCVLAGCEVLARLIGGGMPLWRALMGTATTCAALIAPLLLRLAFPATGSGVTGGFFKLVQKLGWLVMAFRDRWMVWDICSVLLLFGLILWAMRSRRFERSGGLSLAALAFAILLLLLPLQIAGSYYVDMRMVPTLFAFALLALRPVPIANPQFQKRLAIVGLAFFAARGIGTTASLYLYGKSFDRETAAIAHIPRDAALASLTWSKCMDEQPWAWNRVQHLPGLALARRHAFSNDQWVTSGQLLTVHFEGSGRFQIDPSQRVTTGNCRDDNVATLDEALASIPGVFDYLWIIAPPSLQTVRGWHMVWRDGTSGLYRRTRAGKTDA